MPALHGTFALAPARMCTRQRTSTDAREGSIINRGTIFTLPAYTTVYRFRASLHSNGEGVIAWLP